MASQRCGRWRRQSRATRPFLFTPPQATRVRWNMFSDTPLPPEEPAGQNPPDGAILDYYLPAATTEAVLDVVDERGALVRRYSSRDEPEQIDWPTLPYPAYWLRPPQRLSTARGQHRFLWDLRYAPPRGARRELSIAAVHRGTRTSPAGPYVHPGRYTVRLTAGGATAERTLDVRRDPRVSISDADLQRQTDLSLACYRAYQRVQDIREAIDAAADRQRGRREQLTALRGSGGPEIPTSCTTASPRTIRNRKRSPGFSRNCSSCSLCCSQPTRGQPCRRPMRSSA